MIVVSTLTVSRLQDAMDKCSSSDDNKSGAEMLRNFLEYAKSTADNRIASDGESENEFVKSACRLLDREGIEYDVGIGSSAGKIDIGIKRHGEKDGYALGIIVDDPRRADFSGVREYARFAERILRDNCGWRIHRIYPAAWANDYANESKKLLSAIRDSRNARADASA